MQAVTIVFEWYYQDGVRPKLLKTDSANLPIGSIIKSWLLRTTYQAAVQQSASYSHWASGSRACIQTIFIGPSTMLHGRYWLLAEGCLGFCCWRIL